MHTHIYTRAHIYTRTHIHAHIYTRIYTHTHTQGLSVAEWFSLDIMSMPPRLLSLLIKC